jgi:peptide deformylase
MDNLREMVNKYDQEEAAEIIANDKKAEEQQWRCYECPEGVLKLHVYERLDGIFYVRKCNKCSNKTKMKKWTKEVKGIK